MGCIRRLCSRPARRMRLRRECRWARGQIHDRRTAGDDRQLRRPDRRCRLRVGAHASEPVSGARVQWRVDRVAGLPSPAAIPNLVSSSPGILDCPSAHRRPQRSATGLGDQQRRVDLPDLVVEVVSGDGVKQPERGVAVVGRTVHRGIGSSRCWPAQTAPPGAFRGQTPRTLKGQPVIATFGCRGARLGPHLGGRLVGAVVDHHHCNSVPAPRE